MDMVLKMLSWVAPAATALIMSARESHQSINKPTPFILAGNIQLQQRMNRLFAITGPLSSRDDGNNAAQISSITLGAAVVCTIWYTAVSLVCAVGYTQL